MQVDTLRFGSIDVDEAKVITFPDCIPGLEPHSRYVVLRFDESYPIFWLQCIEDSEICLPVIDTFEALEDYAFDIGDDDVHELGINGPEDLHVINVLVIPESIEGMTVNLAAPILMNTRTGRARQVILSGGKYNVRHPVFGELCKLIKEDGHAGSVKED